MSLISWSLKCLKVAVSTESRRGKLSLQQVTNKQNKILEDLSPLKQLGANPRVQNECSLQPKLAGWTSARGQLSAPLASAWRQEESERGDGTLQGLPGTGWGVGTPHGVRQGRGGEGRKRRALRFAPGHRDSRRFLGTRRCGALARSAQSGETLSLPGRPLTWSRWKVLLRGEGAAGGRAVPGARGGGTERDGAAPPLDDAAPADSSPPCHSLLTMVAAQSNKPGRPLPP